MSTRSLKMAAGAAILALGLTVPSAFAWGGLELEKNCSNGLGLLDTTQCSVNIATPSGDQDVHQFGLNANVAVPVQTSDQTQVNKQYTDADTYNMAIQKAEPVAVAVAKSGESKAYGHDADVKIFAPQYADAGVNGFMIVKSETGSADITGSGNGDTTAIGGNTGNFQDADAKIEGEGALAIAKGAIAPGGDSGSNYGASGGDVEDSGNAWALEATLGKAESEGGDGGDACCADNSDGFLSSLFPPSSSCCNTGGAGGSGGDAGLTGGDANATGNGSTTGAGGTQATGAAGDGGTAANISLAKNVGDGANAQTWNSATSGNSTMGDTMGNYIVGGVSGGNKTVGVMAGGSAANVLGVAVTQNGNVTSTSGTATQNGDPKAIAENCLTQSGSTVNQQQWAAPQNSSNNAPPINQSGSNSQSAGQTVSSGWQKAEGLAHGGVEVTLPNEENHHPR